MSQSAPPAATRGQIASVTLGNALEFYDFLVFSFFAIQIGETFFPSTDPINSLLAALATFGAGFLTRPLGAFVIGRYGDRAGRKPAMLLSFALIGVSSLAVALVPSYASIGIAAPILVIVGRLVQGFALGGEVGPSTAFLAEIAPPHRKGVYISLQVASQGAATLAAGIVGVIVAKVFDGPGLADIGWRIALALGALIVPVGIVMRRTLSETLHDDSPVQAAPLQQRYRSIVTIGFFILLSATIATYVMTYLTTYAQAVLKLPADVSLAATAVGGIATIVGAIGGGLLVDRFGCRQIAIPAQAVSAALSVPGFWLLNAFPGEATLYSLSFALRVLVSIAFIGGFTALTVGLPRHVRAGALALVYAIAISVFGGSTQFVIAWLSKISGDPMMPAYYMMVALLIGLVAVCQLPRERIIATA